MDSRIIAREHIGQSCYLVRTVTKIASFYSFTDAVIVIKSHPLPRIRYQAMTICSRIFFIMYTPLQPHRASKNYLFLLKINILTL